MGANHSGKSTLSPAKSTKSGTKTSSEASTPSEVDLSHLTSQELEVIQKVMEKELTFETQEQQRALKIEKIINRYECTLAARTASHDTQAGCRLKIEKMINRYESTLAARIASLDTQAGCRLCFVQRSSDNSVQVCHECNTPVCQMCGSYTAASESEATRWRCKICELKREYLCVTGRWYHAHAGDGKPISPNPISLGISTTPQMAAKQTHDSPDDDVKEECYSSSLEGKHAPPQLQVHRCDSIDTTALHECMEERRPSDLPIRDRRRSSCRNEGDILAGKSHQRSRSIRRLGSVRTGSTRSHSPREHRRASFDVPVRKLSPPPMLTRGSSERSRSRSGEFKRRDSSTSPRPSRTPSIQRRCSTRRRRSAAASEIQVIPQMLYRPEDDVNDISPENLSPRRRHARDESIQRQRRQSTSLQHTDFLLPPIVGTDRRGSTSSWRSHSFRHSPSPTASEDLCIRRSSSLKTGMIRRNSGEKSRASSNRELRRDSLHGSLSRSHDRVPYGSREMYPARESPQFGRPLSRRRASTMIPEFPLPTNNQKALIQRKTSLGNPCSSFTENWLTEALRLNALSQLQRKASDASSHASSHCLMMSRSRGPSFDNGSSCPGLPLESGASLSPSPVRRLSSESMRGQPQLYFNYSQPLLDVPGYYDSGSLSSHRSSADFTSDDPSQYSAYLTASGYTSVTHSGRSSITSTAQSESLRSSLSLASSLTAALQTITGRRSAPEGQELANTQLGPGQAHPDSFNVSAGSIKVALRVTKGKLEIQVLSMADLNLPTSSHVMYVKTCLIHDGQPVLQKKLKLGQHCSSKHKIKYAACDIDASTSLQVMLWAKLKKKRRRQYLGEVCLGLHMLQEESYTAGWYTLFKHAREPCPM